MASVGKEKETVTGMRTVFLDLLVKAAELFDLEKTTVLQVCNLFISILVCKFY